MWVQKGPRDKHLLISSWDWGKGTGCPEAGKAKLNSFDNFITKEIYWPQEHFAHQIELKTKGRAVFARLSVGLVTHKSVPTKRGHLNRAGESHPHLDSQNQVWQKYHQWGVR